MAKSRTRAALDDWLAAADHLLGQERERCISPSSVDGTWTDQSIVFLRTLADVEQQLPAILQRIVDWPGRWILIIEDAECHHHFWQALGFEDGSLVAECVSNYYLEGDELLSQQDEERLLELAWEAPDPPRTTNWITVHPTYSPPVDAVAQRAASTLHEVFGLTDGELVLVKMFSSPVRGGTPASPVVVEEFEPESTSASRPSRSYSRIAAYASDEEAEAGASRFVDSVLGTGRERDGNTVTLND